MRLITTVAALLAVVLLSITVVAWAEGDAPAAEKKKNAASTQARIATLVKDLGSEEYDRRATAFTELEKLGKAAIPALTKARVSADLQVRISAERLLRRIRHPWPDPAERKLSPEFEPHRELDEVWRRLAEQGSPYSLSEEMLGRMRSVNARRIDEVRRRLEELEKDLEQDLRSGSHTASERHIVVSTDEESIDCRVDAEGKVRVAITRRRDGAEKARPEVFEAPNTEEFRKKHPKVWERVKGFLGGGGGLRVEIGRGGRGSPLSRWPFGPTGRGPEAGPKLGVIVGEMTPALRSQLRVAPYEGLLVERVLDGTLAARLGLRRYDVVIRIGDESVGSAKEIAMALKANGPAPVEVRIIRGAKRMDLADAK
jgi:PDZ domain-containing protein